MQITSTSTGVVLNSETQNPATVVTGAYVTNTTPAHSGDAVYGYAPTAWTIANYGTISATQSLADGISLASGIIVNEAAGLIGGVTAVGLGGHAATIANYGMIASNLGTSGVAIDLGNAGDDARLVVGAGSTLVGTVADVAPGDRFDFPSVPFTNDDRVTLGVGDVLQVGTFAVPLAGAGLSGETFFQVADSGTGTLIGVVSNAATLGGIDLSNAATQNPTTIASGSYVTNITAGQGGDALVGSAAAAWTVANYGTLTTVQGGAAGISLAAGGQVANAADGVVAASFEGVYIGGAAPSTVANAGTIAASAGIGVSFGDSSSALVNSGTIAGSGPLGVGAFLYGGSVTNSAGGLIAGYFLGLTFGVYTQHVGGPIAVANFGTLAATGTSGNQVVLFNAGGSLGNYGLITGPAGVGFNYAATAPGTLTNAGTIAGVSLAGQFGAGIGLGLAGGFVRNTATGLISQTGTGSAVAAPSGTLVNFGTIVGAALGTVSANAVGLGGSTAASAGTVVNYGAILGRGPLSPGVALYNLPRGVVANGTDGTIAGVTYGVVSNGTVPGSGAVINAGRIAASGAASFGVRLQAGGTINNRGLIATPDDGADGVYFGGTLDNTGTIAGGDVSGGRGVDILDGGVVNGADSTTAALITGYDGIAGAGGLIANYGTIIGSSALAGAGIALSGHDAVITNGLANDAASLIAGYRYGISIYGQLGSISSKAVGAASLDVTLASIVNFGTVASFGTLGAGVSDFAGGRIVNEHGALITSSNNGVAAYAPLLINNYGTISGAAASGIYFLGGTITNAFEAAIVGQQAGVSIVQGTSGGVAATILNGSTIAGGIGIALGPQNDGADTIINNGTIVGASGTAVQFGAGADELVIGSGSTLAGVIANMQPGDTIDLAAIPFASVTGSSLSANNVLAITASGGRSVSVGFSSADSFAGEIFTLSNAGPAGTAVSLSPAPPSAEVFWTNPADGNTGYWTFNATGGVAGFDDLGSGSTTYTATAIGRFDGTGDAEVLWENSSTGDTGYWTTAGGQVTGFNDLGQADTAYSIVGAGDFDGSGHDEVVWEDKATGNTGYWITNGEGQVTGFNNFGSADTAYSVVGIGDFDNSGHAEVLWEDKATGDAGYWLTNATGQVIGFDNLGAADTAYSVVGTGDFDGTGQDEVLWENPSTGDVGYWTLSDGAVTGFHDFGFASTAYTVAATGDYDGSGHDEVLWENPTTGDSGYWTTSFAGQITGFHDLGSADTSYHIVPAG